MNAQQTGQSVPQVPEIGARPGQTTLQQRLSGHSIAALLALACLAAQSVFGQTRDESKQVDKNAASFAASLPANAAAKSRLGEQNLWANERYPFPATKLDHGLRLAWQTAMERGKGAALAQLAAEKATLAANGEDVVVIVFPSAGTTIEQLETAVQAVGATIIRSGPDTIKAAFPIDKLSEAAQIPGVSCIRNLLPPREKNVTTTEGLSATLANAWHTAGHRGSGVKIAVVDMGYANLATLKAQDEIPAAATEVNYTASGMTAGSLSHGSACAEVVYDMAPQAQMYLIKIDDPTDLLTVKNYCIAQGINVVSFSVGWDALNFHDGIAYANWFTTVANHPVTAVDLATSAGILWVNAAGNEQMKHVLIDWRDGNADTALDWNSSYGAFNKLYLDGSSTLPAGTVLNLYMTWNQWPTTSQDFDLELYRWTGTAWSKVTTGYQTVNGRFCGGADTQNGSTVPYPYERLVNVLPYTAEYGVVIKSWGTTTTPKFILRCYGASYPTYNVYNSYDLAPGSICIPGDAASAFTVGAIDYATYTTGPIEGFSSLGPNNRAYTGGTAVTKPDICGPDFVTSVSYGSEPFGGTSAATPHIGGLAALVKGAYPSYTLAQLKQYLETNGYDLGIGGKDNTYGSGASRLPSPPSSNHAPTDIALSASSINENVPANSTVGTFSTTDPDAGNTFTYTLVSGTGSTDNGACNISGSSLRITASPDHEAKSSYSVCVRTTDQGGLWYEEAFMFTINDVNETPVIAEGASVPVTMSEDGSPTAFNLTLNATDPDTGATLTWSVPTQAGHGAATASGTGVTKAIGYTPTANWNGADNFVVRVSDGALTDEITVNVTVNPRNDPPNNTAAPTVAGTHHAGQTLTAQNGDWNDTTDLVPGTLVYTHQWRRAADASGTNAEDILGATAPSYMLVTADNGKHVCVVVTASDDGEGIPATQSTAASSAWTPVTNAAPIIAQGESVAAEMDENGTPEAWIAPRITAMDADNDPLIWSLHSPPAHGTAEVGGTGPSPTPFTYTPPADWIGSDRFVVQVADPYGGTDQITVNVTVRPHLAVASAHGIASPAVGTHTHPVGTELTATVTSPDEQGQTRYLCTGWTGTGSVPASGAVTSVTFTLDADSSITWNWATEHRLEVATSGSGTVDVGSGWRAVGSEVALTASPAANHRFARWTGDLAAIVVGGDTTAAITVRMDGPVALTAVFEAVHTVTFVAGEHGTITAGDAVQLVTHGQAAVAPTITAADGWTFTGWDVPFNNVTADLTVTAQYTRATYQLAVASAHGTPSPAVGTHALPARTEVTATVTSPDVQGLTRYVCTGWAGTGSVPASGAGTSVTFTLEADSSLTWNWATEHRLEVATSGSGTVDVGSGWRAAGSEVILAASPAGNHRFARWTGELAAIVVGGETTTAITVRMNTPVALTAVFEAVHTVTFVAGEHGMITAGEAVQQVPHGQAAVAPTITAADGWSFAGWDVPFGNVTADLTITAQYTRATYQLAVASAHGTPSPAVGTHTHPAGTEVTASVTSPDEQGQTRYVCTGWTGTGSVPASGGGTSVTFTLENDSSITWNWATEHRLEVATSDNGTVDVGSGWRTAGSEVTLTASPAANHRFVRWTGDLAAIVAGGETTAAITVRIDAPVALTAVFEAVHTVTFVAGEHGTITAGDAVQQVPHGQAAVAPTITAADGWAFTGWDLPFDNVTADLTITAQYTRATYQLAVASAHGTPSPAVGSHPLPSGTNVTATVTSPDVQGQTRYVCTGWTGTGSVPASGGGTSVTFTLEDDSSITWNWATEHRLEVATSGNGTVDVASGWRAAGSEVALTATAAASHRFVRWTGDLAAIVAGGETTAAITVRMDAPVGLVAEFAGTSVVEFARHESILIPDAAGNASPWPSVINVTGVSGEVVALRVKLNGVAHSWPDDIDAFLMAPDGKVCALMSDAGGGTDVNCDLVFDDAAAGGLPDSQAITAGSYQATDFEAGEALPPGGTGTIGTDIMALTAPGVNGQWKLFVSDDTDRDAGEIASWALVIEFIPSVIESHELAVASAHGTPSPAVGSHTHPAGTEVTATVTSPDEQGQTRYVCTGWTGTGSVPASGGGTSVSFTLDADSSLTWNWATEHRLEVATSGNGTVDVASGWRAAGSEVTLTATAAANHRFARWTGDLAAIVVGGETTAAITVRMNTPVALTAVFEGVHTVTFVAGEHGTITAGDAAQQVPHGQAAVAPTITAADGWAFTGWDLPFDNVTTDLTVTAQYTRTTYQMAVASPHGTPSPAVGSHSLPQGANVTATVVSPDVQGQTRYVCTGWSGTGSVPASGGGTSATFTLDADSSITWNWATQYWLEVATSGGGGAVDIPSGWHVVGSRVVLTATAAPDHQFTGWTGDTGAIVVGDPSSPQITVQMDAPVALVAGFADDGQAIILPATPAQPAGFSGPVRNSEWTVQFVTDSTLLAGLPLGGRITGMAYRLDGGVATWPPSDRTWDNYDIQLSASRNNPGMLSRTYGGNTGADAVTVRSGPLTVPAGGFPGGGEPNPFGSIIPFGVPYSYPGGDLLVTIRHTGNGVDYPLLDAAGEVLGEFQCLYSSGTGAYTAVAATAGSATPVVRLTYQPPTGPGEIMVFNGPTRGHSQLMDGQTDPVIFGSMLAGRAGVPRTFTIGNAGGMELAGLSVSVSGPQASDFTVTQPTSAVLGGGLSQMFQVTFTPGEPGPRTAVLHIASSDANEGSFDIPIQGAGATPARFITFQEAALVLGQSDFAGNSATASRELMPGPNSIAVGAGGLLAVGDQVANRVLIWNAPPHTNGQPADVVVGQATFTDTTTGATASRLAAAEGIAFSPDGRKLIVCDGPQNRVLVWNTVPTANDTPADVVIGQTDFTSTAPGLSGTSLSYPTGVLVSPDGRLLVADLNNNRVLVFAGIPTTNGAAADVVIGQVDMTSNTAGTGASQLRGPWGLALAPDGRLLVADADNHRVVVFGSIPATNGAAAEVVIGQSGFGSGTAAAGAAGMDSPLGVAVAPDGRLAVAEFGNHRVTLFDTVPTSHGAAANVVLGQPDFGSYAEFAGGISASSMRYPYAAAFAPDGSLLVAGRYMSRLMSFARQSAHLVYNTNDSGPGSLRDAIEDAAPGTTITFDPELDGHTITLTGGQLSIAGNLIIDASALPGGLTVSAGGTSRVIEVAAGATVTIKGLAIADGRVDHFTGVGGAILNHGVLELFDCTVSASLAAQGGGLWNSGFARLTRTRVTENASTGAGAGIHNQGGLELIDAEVRANETAFHGGGGPGGGIYNGSSGNAMIYRTAVSFNCALRNQGGGICNRGSLVVEDSFIDDNEGTQDGGFGGGVYNEGTLRLTGCKVRRNHVYLLGAGGGIYNRGEMILTDCSVEDCGADSGGAGIECVGGTTSMTNCTLAGNEVHSSLHSWSTGGGGIRCAGRITMVNCTVAGNQAMGKGAGIRVISGDAELVNCTISGNHLSPYDSPEGGGIYNDAASLHIENSIVAGNTAGSREDNMAGATYTEAGRNLLSGDPQLAPLGDYGGFTQTMPPLPGSPAVDAGVATSLTPATDQRGLPRPWNGDGDGNAVVDIGAVELIRIEVTTAVDELDGNTTSPALLVANPGGTWISLREAIETSDHVGGGLYVVFAATLDGGTIALNGSQLQVDEDITIDASALANRITVSGNDASRVIGVGSGSTVLIKGMTISGGLASDAPGGGGIVNEGMLSLISSKVCANRCRMPVGDPSLGGGIWNGGTLQIVDSEISGNGHDSIFEQTGGGIYNAGTLTLLRSVVHDNESNRSAGGGICNVGSMFAEDTSFTGNQVAGDGGFGGAIAHGGPGSLTLVRCVFEGNRVYYGGQGGAIYNTSQATLTECEVADCSADSNGGGIANVGGTMVLNGCTFSENQALGGGAPRHGGGGAYNSGELSIVNCTFSGNHAGGGSASHGGGALAGSAGGITVVNSSIVGNSAGWTGGGGGIRKGGGTLHVENSIICGNMAGSGEGNVAGGIDTEAGRNLIGGDPLLAPLGDYGGHTRTTPPLPGSPAIDAGIVTPNTPPTDQRGVTRPQGAAIDIGAVEVGGPDDGRVMVAVAPATGAEGVGVRPELAWVMPLLGADSFEIFLGTNEGGLASISTFAATAPEFQFPGFLAPATTYFWRVDSTRGGVTHAGVVFSFTTRPAIEVTTELDQNDPGLGQGGGDSLRECLAAAATAAGADTIGFATDLGGQTIVLGGSHLVIDSDVNVDASMLWNGIAVSGGFASRVLHINPGCSVAMHRLTIKEGDVESSNGAGILNAGSLTLRACTVEDNRVRNVQNRGAGVFNSGTLEVIDSKVRRNICEVGELHGAGIFSTGTLTIRSSEVVSNRGFEGRGGGLCSEGTLYAVDSVISGNRVAADAGQGGAVYCAGKGEFIRCRMENNVVEYGGIGGGLYTTGHVNVTDCAVIGCEAASGGAGINNDGGELTLAGCTIAGNRVSGDMWFLGGGGIRSAGTLVMHNSTIANNSAFGSGGGLRAVSGSVELTNCTIYGNKVIQYSSFRAGGIFNDGATLHIENTIVARNTLGSVDDNIVGAITTEAGRNFIDGDPMLAPLGDYGEPTPTMSPLPGSPVIDAGIATPDTPATDQRGLPRPLDGNGDGVAVIDIGAVEFAPLTVTTSADELDGDTTSPAGLLANPGGIGISLREAIETSNHAGGGLYVDFHQDLDGATITLAAEQLTLSEDLTIDAMGLPAGISVSGGGKRVMHIVDGAAVRLIGLTIRDGNRGMSPGGGIFNESGTIEVLDCRITGNFGMPGGGLANSGTARIERSEISGNQCAVSSGAGIHNDGTMEIVDSWIRRNYSEGGGGGIRNEGMLILDGCRIEDCSTGSWWNAGGGILNQKLNPTGGSLIMNKCTVSGCSSWYVGGGVANYGGEVAMTKCTIHDNWTGPFIAGGGGSGIASDGILRMVDCTVADNRARSGSGAGIGCSGTATLINCTVADNEATGNEYDNRGGGGISSSGNLILENSIVAGNSSSTAGPDILGSITTERGVNLIGNLADISPPPVGVVITGPARLACLGDYGGPTWTMLPLPGSPAINAGIATPEAPVTDQRGKPRPQGSAIDLGAVEVAAGDHVLASSPADGASGVVSRPALVWFAPTSWACDRFQVLFGTQAGQLAVIGEVDGTVTRFELPDHLLPLRTFFWRIDSVRGGCAVPSAEFRFATADGPLAAEVYETWADDAGLMEADRDPDASPFGDGVSNLAKFAFNMNGSGPDAHSLCAGTGLSGLPCLTCDASVLPAVFRFEFVRRKLAGMSYRPVQSDSLAGGSWLPAAGRITFFDIDAEWERVVVEQEYVPAVTPNRFFRVELTLDGGPPAGFAWIPAGEFLMGDAMNDGLAQELPVHPVQVSDFLMAKHEVTKGLWDDVRTWGLAHGYNDLPDGAGKAPDHPVVSINWDAMVKWCNARSEMEDLTPCYRIGGAVWRLGTGVPTCDFAAGGYRLPTEAEWEKAARGGVAGLRFPWGDTISHAQANYYVYVAGAGNYFPYDVSVTPDFHPDWDVAPAPYTSRVGSFEANGYGLFDMAGNVTERCWDYYGNYPAGLQSDPTGPATPSPYRIARGGSWRGNAVGIRISHRHAVQPGELNDQTGFRLARSAAP